MHVIVCLNNTLTGDASSCDAAGCRCIKPGYLQPNCCICDIENNYLPECERKIINEM